MIAGDLLSILGVIGFTVVVGILMAVLVWWRDNGGCGEGDV